MIAETPQDDSTHVEDTDSAPVADTTQPADTPDDATPESPNHEAARYRVKLREAEAERDALATRLANMQRAQVDAHITTMGLKPRAVWASGAELADLLNEDGVPDEQKVRQAVESARRELGIDTPKRSAKGLRSGLTPAVPRATSGEKPSHPTASGRIRSRRGSPARSPTRDPASR